jgi:hypothetical protein
VQVEKRLRFQLLRRWTRLRPIRTISEVALEFVVFTTEPFSYQRIAPEARKLRALGMTFRAIGHALGVDDKTVRKALLRERQMSRES